MSGYNENMQKIRQLFKDNEVELIQKPFSGERLLAVVRQCIDAT